MESRVYPHRRDSAFNSGLKFRGRQLAEAALHSPGRGPIEQQGVGTGAGAAGLRGGRPMRVTGAVALLVIPAVLLADDETLPPPRLAPTPLQVPASPGLPLPPALPPRVLNLPPVPETPSTAPELAAAPPGVARCGSESEALAAEPPEGRGRHAAGRIRRGHPAAPAAVRARGHAQRLAHWRSRPPAAEVSPASSPAGAKSNADASATAPRPGADATPGDPVLAARARCFVPATTPRRWKPTARSTWTV